MAYTMLSVPYCQWDKFHLFSTAFDILHKYVSEHFFTLLSYLPCLCTPCPAHTLSAYNPHLQVVNAVHYPRCFVAFPLNSAPDE